MFSGLVIPQLANTNSISSEIKYCINYILYNESTINIWNISDNINGGKYNSCVNLQKQISDTGWNTLKIYSVNYLTHSVCLNHLSHTRGTPNLISYLANTYCLHIFNVSIKHYPSINLLEYLTHSVWFYSLAYYQMSTQLTQ